MSDESYERIAADILIAALTNVPSTTNILDENSKEHFEKIADGYQIIYEAITSFFGDEMEEIDDD